MHAQFGALEENLGSALLPALVSLSRELAKLTGFLAKHTTTAKIAVIAIGLLAAALLAASVATSIMTAATLALDVALSPLLIPILAVIGGLVLLGAAIFETIKHWQQIRQVMRDVWNDIKQVFDAGINFVKDHWRAFAIALGTILLGPLGGLVIAIATHWGQIKQDAAAAFNAVRGAIGNAWDGITSRVSAGISAVVSLVKSLPGKIVAALGNLSRLLYNAGASIIQGLLDGLKSKLHDVENLAGSIAGKIKSLKGPLEVDRVLLVPAGQAIIGGLQAGMESALPGVYGLAASIGPKISTGAAAALPSGGGTAGAGGGIHVHIGPVNGTADATFAKLLANQLAIQLRGGRVPQLQQAIKAN
jgi:uncharacterized protein YejL (UPF0352 family)